MSSSSSSSSSSSHGDPEHAAATNPKKRRREVLEEEEYVADLEKLIARDYFPEAPAARDAAEEEASEVVYRRAHNDDWEEDDDVVIKPELLPKPVRRTDNISLDKYVRAFTTEDNESYEELAERERVHALESVEHLYAAAKKHNLAITDKSGIKFTVKNALMFTPQALDVQESQTALVPHVHRKAIVPQNTRFPGNFVHPEGEGGKIARLKQINLDVSGSTPMVDGYRILRTPVFQVPPTPHREELGHKLSERHSMLTKTLKGSNSSSSSAYNTGVGANKRRRVSRFGTLTSTQRMDMLSPAANKLLHRLTGGRTPASGFHGASGMRTGARSGGRRTTPTTLSAYVSQRTPKPLSLANTPTRRPDGL
jgi:hypothetical protein